jgi:type II secretory pathway component PulF
VAFVRLRQRMAFLRGLLSMLKAGVPLTTALADLGRVHAAGVRQILRRAEDRLRAGATLAEALDELADLVDPVTRALLAGGEQSGRLEQVLARRLEQMEESRRLAGRILVYFIYPLYLLAGLILVGPLLSLPAAIQAGASTGSLGSVYLREMVGMAGLAAGAAAMLFTMPLAVRVLGLECATDRIVLRLPVFGSLLREMYGARLASGLATAIGAGVEVGRALRLATLGMSSPSRSPRIELAAARLADGGSFTEAVAEFGVIDLGSLGQVAVAERTGELDRALDTVALELWQSVVRRARLAAFLLLGVLVAGLLAVVVVKLLGLIFGPIARAYRLPDELDRL